VQIGSIALDSLDEPYYGVDRAIFRDYGVNAQVTTFANGSTVVQATLSGDMDVGLSNIVQVTAGVARGLPLVMVAPAALYSAAHALSALCVTKTSPLASAKDRMGMTVAVSTLNDFKQLGVEAWLKRNKIPLSSVKFVELQFGEMGPALQRGTVAAATISEPALSAAINNGQARVFADVYSAIAPVFANIIWFATKLWIQKNADTAKKLNAGIYATARWANSHLSESATIIARAAKLEPAVVAGMRRAFLATSNNPKYVQSLLDAAFRFGTIPRRVTSAEFIAQRVMDASFPSAICSNAI
jgi:NitT/TauT family transport system substrate-binding protein